MHRVVLCKTLTRMKVHQKRKWGHLVFLVNYLSHSQSHSTISYLYTLLLRILLENTEINLIYECWNKALLVVGSSLLFSVIIKPKLSIFISLCLISHFEIKIFRNRSKNILQVIVPIKNTFIVFTKLNTENTDTSSYSWNE